MNEYSIRRRLRYRSGAVLWRGPFPDALTKFTYAGLPFTLLGHVRIAADVELIYCFRIFMAIFPLTFNFKTAIAFSPVQYKLMAFSQSFIRSLLSQFKRLPLGGDLNANDPAAHTRLLRGVNF